MPLSFSQDLDDCNFDVDFNITFSWLVRAPPQTVLESLHRERRLAKTAETADITAVSDFSETQSSKDIVSVATKRLW